MKNTDSNFAVVLKGEIITEILGAKEDSKLVNIKTKSGRHFVLYHDQDCCEVVKIDSVKGDLEYILNHEVTKATELIVSGYPSSESATKTIFGIEANYSSFVIEWIGESNGYYSESVSFMEINNEPTT
jgi:hypothetical protein